MENKTHSSLCKCDLCHGMAKTEPSEVSSTGDLLAQFYDFIEANKFADGIDDIQDAVKQTTWVFLSRWQKVKVAFAILLQSLR